MKTSVRVFAVMKFTTLMMNNSSTVKEKVCIKQYKWWQ